MSHLLFTSFTLTIAPNSAPTWEGSIPYVSFRTEIRILTVSLPINVTDEFTEYVNFDLWIDETSKENESEMKVSGTLHSTRVLTKQAHPVVITPCQSFIDVDEDEDGVLDFIEYDIIHAETFEQAVYALFESTGWEVTIACEQLRHFPVVTEMEPILVLNGSKLEQLGIILDLFIPNDLWGQELTYVVNPFTNKIIITPPTKGETNTNDLSASDARLFDVSFIETDIDVPQKIYIQEDPSCVFRSPEHFKEFGLRNYDYDFETSIHEDLVNPTHSWSDRFEDWEKDLDIVAKLSGEQIIVGDTVIVDVEETTIFTIETRILNSQLLTKMQFPLFGAPYLAWEPIWYKWVTTRATNIKSRTEYSYIIGPPYNDPMLFIPCDDSNRIIIGDQEEDNWWDNLPFETVPDGPEEEETPQDEEVQCISGANKCFDHSLAWTTSQIARDYGAVIIDKDHMPEYITSNEGLRIYTKKIIAVEQSGRDIFYTDKKTQDQYTIPEMEDLDRIDTAVTIAEEKYGYDENGNLIGVHEHKQVKTATDITVEDSFKVYKPITKGLTSVITYTVSRKYDTEYNLISTSVTDVDADTVTGDVTGPSAVSPMESIEEKEVTRTELFRQQDERTVLKLLTKTISHVKDYGTGVLYITMDNLIIEEIELYLLTYYNVTPKAFYEVGFSSNFIDVRGIIGGYLRLTDLLDPNRPVAYDLDTIEMRELYNSGIYEAMEERPFRVNGITMNWDKEGKLTVAVAVGQVI